MSAATDTRFPVPSEGELVITRVINAPREDVFEAWTDAETIKQWSAPHGFTIAQGSAEHHPGGAWRCCMRSPEGSELWLGGVYREITPPERLVFTHAWDDEDGKPGRETVVTVCLETLDGRTFLTLRQTGFESRESRDGHEGGWSQCLDKLAGLLART